MKKTVIFLFAMATSCLPFAAAAETTALAEKEYGDAWADLGNWKRAVEHYQKAIDKNPELIESRLRLANGLYRLGKKKSALAQLNELRRKKPRSVAVASAIGVIQLDLKKPRKACKSFDRALAQDENHQRSIYGLGQCHMAIYEKTRKEDEKKTAMSAFSSYLEKFPKGPYAVFSKDALDKLRFGQVGQTMAEAKEAFAKGKYRLARNLFEKVVAKEPGLAEAHYLLGMTLATPVVGDIEKAREQWAKAGEMKEALLQRGILAYEEDDLEDAVDLLEKATKIDPDYAKAHYQLGLVYQNLLLNEKAMQSFRKAQAAAPKSPLAERASSKLQLLTGQLRYLNEGEIIDTASEIELGRKLTTMIEKRFGVVENEKLQVRLNRILRRITRHSDRPPSALPYRVKILKIEGINALAFVGGTIYLCKGLVDFIRREMGDSDDAFAVVIGHEVVHLVMRHGLGMLDLVGGTRALMEGKSLDVRGINKLMVGMSRKHEFEADQVGCLYAYRAGFNPSSAFHFHRKLLSRGKEIPEGLDHPTHSERAERLKEYLLGLRTKARHFDAGMRSLDEHDYEWAIRHFEIFLGMFPQSWAARNNLGVAKHRWAMGKLKGKRDYKLSTDIDPRAKIKPIVLRGGKSGQEIDRALMIEAAEIFRSLAERNPEYVSARLNLGSCLVALGEQDKARKLFEKVAEEKPESVEASTNLAVLHLMEDRRDEGIELLEKVIAQRPRFADARYNMALALSKAGKKDEARKAWLAFLEVDQSSGWAASAREHLADLK